jgi:HK97 family phage major capsid protein
MPTIVELREKYAEAVKPAQDIIAKAQAEARAFSDDEKKAVKAAMDAAQPFEKQIVAYRETEDLTAKMAESLGIGIETPKTPDNAKANGPLSLGEQFVASAEYKRLVKGGMSGGRWTSGPVELKTGLKATLTTTTGAALVQPDVRPGILPILFERLTVADLMPNTGTNSNTVRYMKETVATNAAGTVAEEAAKPESTLEFDDVDESVRKIATWLPVTDEMLEDVAQIRGYIDGRLRLFVQMEEEDQLLNGDGTAPNISGLLDRAGIGTQALGVDSRADAIFKAMNKVEVDSFLRADGIVVNPADWQDIRLEKDSNANYYGPGPFDGGSPDRIWGLRAVVTSAIAAGTALVGAYATAAQVFRKSGITVEASNSHSDFFTKNKTAIRAEERLALAVYREAAFVKVTGI